MIVVRAIGLFAANLLWRMTDLKAAGRVLVRALGSQDENIRTIAGMLLTRGGKKSRSLLLEALDRRENLSLVLTVIGSIGDREFIAELRGFSNDPDPDVAKTARDALRLIEAQQPLS